MYTLCLLHFSLSPMEEAIVIYPASMLTHLAPMVEFAKLLLTQHPSLSIHILIATLPSQPSSTVPSPVPPSITFHYLPTFDLLPTSTDLDPLFFDVIRLRNPDVRRTLLTISNNYTLNAIIVDFFCTSAAFEVASDLNLPAYSFLPTALGAAACLLYLPTLCNKFTQSFQHLNVLLDIPGAPPIPSADMPPTTFKGNKLYDVFLDIATNLPRSTGIIVDTFEYLEPKSFKEINDGLCLPDYPTPPLYCIGPLIVNTTVDGDGVPQCIKWVLMVEEMKIALPMVESETGFVSSTEVEKRVKELMGSKEGDSVRERALAMKHAARVATSEGGSTRIALAKLVESWKQK
ncbi:hypothetical protein V6Z12_D12G289400 [Gossypium hirsutum]